MAGAGTTRDEEPGAGSNDTSPRCRTLVRRLSRVLAVVSALALIVLMLLIAAEVLRRSITGASIPGIIEFSEVLLVVAAFFGMAYAQRNRDHVATQIGTHAMPPRAAAVAQFAGLVVLGVTVAAMAWLTATSAWSAFRSGDTTFGLAQVPTWPARAAVSIGLLAMLLEVFVNLADQFRSLGRDGSLP